MAGASATSARLRAVSVRLKAAGDRGNRLALLRGLKSGAAPLVPLVGDAARAQLPKRGGLNERVAGEKVKVSVRLGARTAGVRLTTTAPDTKLTNSGFVEHPVFGRWITGLPLQAIPKAAGWWTTTLQRHSPEVTPDLLAELKRIEKLIQRGV